jgi:hypothetical protein
LKELKHNVKNGVLLVCPCMVHGSCQVKEAKQNAEDGVGLQGSMMSVGLHCRLAGRPGRTAGLEAFLDHAKALEVNSVIQS